MKYTSSLISLELKNRGEREKGVQNYLSHQTQLLSWTQGQKKLRAFKLATKPTELWQFAPIKNLVTDCFWFAVSLPAEKPLLWYVWWMHIIAGWAEIQSLSTGQGREKKNILISFMLLGFENICIEIITVLFNNAAS